MRARGALLATIALVALTGCTQSDERRTTPLPAAPAVAGPRTTAHPSFAGTSLPSEHGADAGAQPDELRAATSPAAPGEPVQREPGRADLDPDNDEEVGPPELIEDCHERLRSKNVRFKPAKLPVSERRHARGTYSCGSHDAVVYLAGPGGIRYVPAPVVDCGMALALANAEPVIEEEAARHLGARVRVVRQMGTYSCRRMAAYQLVSEHAYANAIDIQAFELDNGQRASVLRDFGRARSRSGSVAASSVEAPLSNKAQFLRTVAHRWYDEGVFSVVLTPLFDSLHENHFHVDLARYRLDGTR